MRRRFLKWAILIMGGFIAAVCLLEYWADSDDKAQITDSDVLASRRKLGDVPPPTRSASTPIPLDKAIRVAIGGLGMRDDDQNRNLSDLITVELGNTKGLELVDRGELETVLREVQLSLSGLVRAKDAIRAGKLLRVDWFLFGTTAKINGSNSIVVRLVDAHTGIMQNGGTFAEQEVPRLASQLAAFVRQSRQAAAEAKPQVYLAIGGFQDLSENNRLATLPAQLRTYLTAAYQQSNITMLEREFVDVLLHEVWLDIAGLTEEGGSNKITGMQSAFWLVDVCYQSYETTNITVELSLKVQRIYGRSKTVLLRDPPGEPAFRHVKAVIDACMSQDADLVMPSRLSEIRAQMNIGRELSQLNSTDNLTWPLTYTSQNHQEGTKRKRNTEEAIRAFQTVLLLDPQNREARMYLAACIRSSFPERMVEARDYYREIIESPDHDKWTTNAQKALVWSFPDAWWSDKQEKVQWFEAAARRKTINSFAVDFYQRETEAAREKVLLRGEGKKSQELAATRLLADITNSTLLDNLSSTIDDYVETFGSNKTAAAQGLNALYPALKQQAPKLTPYLLAEFVSYQVDTNAAIVVEFKQTLDELAKNPNQAFLPERFWQHIWPAYEWSCNHGFYDIATKIMECKNHFFSRLPRHITEIDDDDSLGLAFAYVGQKRWDDALKIFETFSNQPVQMWHSGPWGNMFTYVFTSKRSQHCREKLGLPVVSDQRQFLMGTNCLCLHSPSAFAADSDGLWVGIENQLLHLDFNLKTNVTILLPKEAETPVNCVCLGPSNIWIGTSDDGLIEFDKATRQCRRLTEHDGLKMNSIACLNLTQDRLLIGYGFKGEPSGGASAVGGGGLGYMDMVTRRIVSYSLSLADKSGIHDAKEVSGKPTESPIEAIAAGNNGDIWYVTRANILRRYCPRDNVWEPAYKQRGNCLVADQEKLYLGFSWNHFGKSKSGLLGVTILDLQSNQWQSVPEAGGLRPGAVSTLCPDGQYLWVGGFCYVARLDQTSGVVQKYAYVPAKTIDQIQIGGGYVWAKYENHLHRANLADLQ